jgi:hypothetical protein
MDTDLALTAEAAPAAARVGQPIRLAATLSAPVAPQGVSVTAQVRDAAGGEPMVIDLPAEGAGYGASWTPSAPGEYTIVIQATGADAAGNPFERLAVLGASVTE